MVLYGPTVALYEVDCPRWSCVQVVASSKFKISASPLVLQDTTDLVASHSDMLEQDEDIAAELEALAMACVRYLTNLAWKLCLSIVTALCPSSHACL